MSNVTLLLEDAAGALDIEARRNAAFTYTFEFVDVDGDTLGETPMDLTDFTAACSFMRKSSDNTVTVVHTSTNANDELVIGVTDGDDIDLTNGKVAFAIPTGTMYATFEARTYEYEFRLIDADGEVAPGNIVAGNFRVIRGKP